MHPFVLSLFGGILIGLASALLLLTNGRIAGISGIVGGLFGANREDFGWRAAFFGGLLVGGAALAAIAPQTIGAPIVGGGVAIAAGLLVGFGTRLGSGCTSGHGICGLSRGSLRSLVATMTFMVTAAATVFVTRHIFGA